MWIVLHVEFWSSVWEQKVVCSMLLNFVLVSVPLLLFWFWSLQVVFLVLKSPTINACGLLPSWCSLVCSFLVRWQRCLVLCRC